MKVMLINPDSELAKNNLIYRKLLAPVLPMGIAYVAAVLEKNGVKVVAEDQFASKISNEQLCEKIFKEGVDVVGISCLTANASNVKKISSLIRGKRKDIKIVLGNIHATLFADQLLSENIADVVVKGEGEYSMLDLVLTLERGDPLAGVAGISFKEDGGEIHHNKPRDLVSDLDDLPYPAWHLFDFSLYRRYPILGIRNTVVLPVLASRGCPYRCIFCSQDKMYEKPRYRKIGKVVDEIECMHEKFGVKYVGFNDAYFPFSVKAGLDFCEEFIKRKLHKKVRWITETRVDKVDLPLLKRMKEAAVDLIMYGLEVGSQKILDIINKAATIEQAENAMKYTKKAGIRTLGLFILGLPGETQETCEETIRFAKKLDCDLVKFNIAIPQPGSSFFETWKSGLDKMPETDKFTSWWDLGSGAGELVYAPPGMKYAQLLNLQRKAMFVYYFRFRIMIRHLIRRSFSFSDLYYGGYILVSNYLMSWRDKIASPQLALSPGDPSFIGKK